MKIDRVKVSFGRTVSSGTAFEFIRADVGLEAEVEPDENRVKVRKILRDECRKGVYGIIAKELEELHGQ